MSKAIVARPAEGITINDAMEYLLDDDGDIQILDSPEHS